MKITLIPGDGIGPEIIKSLKAVMEKTGLDITWEEYVAGADAYKKTGTYLPEELFQSLEKNKIGIKGPVTTPIGEGFSSVNVALRKKYDLYANIRPVKRIGKVPSLYPNVDIIIFRENTEDLYAGIEKQISPTEAHSIKVITQEKSIRIIKKAFDYAKEHGIEKVTVVTKANIMKLTDGLFLQCARDVAKNYKGIQLEEVLIDNMCMQLVMHPENYKVIVTENLYGDILSDLCAGLVGGLGLIPGANIGENLAIFEAVHGSAPDIAGKDLANPTAILLSGAMLLDYIGHEDKGNSIRKAIEKVLSNTDNFTYELGGKVGTREFTTCILKEMER
ncbi:MAG: isocitrate/isopropylmalate dehydrogenase family protein [Tissierellia bacterium]|nr:isocitrate/isopropylmalate dehydrogenase family protein [Tissierellia bacterium]